MKKLILFLMGCTFVLTNISSSIYADELEDSKLQYSTLSEELKTLDEEIANTNLEIEKLQSTISNNENSINLIEQEIDNTQTKITSLEEDITSNEKILSIRLREMYKTGSFTSLNYIVFLLESNNLSDFIDRITACTKIINQDKELISEVKDKVSELNNQKENITSQKNNLVALNTDTKSKLSQVESKNAELTENKSKLNQEKEKLIGVITKNEENLISNSITVINSSSSTLEQLTTAVSTLNALVSQLTISSVTSKANSAINKGEEKIAALKSSSNSNSNSSVTNNSYLSAPSNGSAIKTFTMEATAYSLHSTTSMGIAPVRNPNGISTVAVDTSVIPLGSKVYVVGYGYAIAADTGSAIVGNKIDLYMNSSSECYNFGRQTVTVYLMAYPGEW